MPTKQIIKLASAFTSGLTPSFTFEKITMGSVLAPGPETKLEITKSSRDSVKLSSQLDSQCRSDGRQGGVDECPHRAGA